jgi:predicted phosphodiesterase
MRYLILSDIHANWEALRAVLRRVRRKRFDATLFLGDLVGYGGAPNQVVDAMQDLPGRRVVIRGNHDKVIAGIDGGDEFNETAMRAVFWTRERLTRAHRHYLEELPEGPKCVETDVRGNLDLAICHGSPVHEDLYVFSELEAWEAFQAPPRAFLTLFGHTHVPCLYRLEDEGLRGKLLRGNGSIVLEPGYRYLINPGSVGQPRDRDPRAAYAIYDSATRRFSWRRQEYPVGIAQERMRRAGLPRSLADRLAYGL